MLVYEVANCPMCWSLKPKLETLCEQLNLPLSLLTVVGTDYPILDPYLQLEPQIRIRGLPVPSSTLASHEALSDFLVANQSFLFNI